MLMTEQLPNLEEMADYELSARTGIPLPPRDPAVPLVTRGDGLKFVSFRGRLHQFADDGSFDIPTSFEWNPPEKGDTDVSSEDRL